MCFNAAPVAPVQTKCLHEALMLCLGPALSLDLGRAVLARRELAALVHMSLAAGRSDVTLNLLLGAAARIN